MPVIQKPRRWRTISPLFFCASGVWIAAGSAYTIARTVDVGSLRMWAVGLDAAVISCIVSIAVVQKLTTACSAPVALRYQAKTVLLLFGIGLLVGSTAGVSCALQMKQTVLPLDREASYTVRMQEDPRAGSYGYQALVDIDSAGNKRIRVLAYFDSDEAMYCGDAFEVSLSSATRTDGDNYAWSKGAAYTIRMVVNKPYEDKSLLQSLRGVRKQAIESCRDSVYPTELITALACGWREGLRESSIYGDFKACGLAHMVAVSGAHLVIVTSLILVALKRLKTGKYLRILIVVASMLAYFVLAGMPVSALRACAMSALSLTSFIAKRKSAAMNGLAVAVIMILLHDPSAALSASFTFSVLATLGILLYAQDLEEAIALRLKLPGWIVQPAMLTIASNILVLPLSCALFSQLPLIAMVANIACAPLFVVCCALSLIAALAASTVPATAGFAIGVASLFSEAMTLVVHILASIPYACIPAYVEEGFAYGLIVVILSTTLFLTFNKRALCAGIAVAAGCLLAFSIAYFGQAQATEIVMLDVGQGDAILIRSGGKTLLVDTGRNDSKLLAGLSRHAVFSLDYVLVTHADDDHCGSLDALSVCVPVKRALLAQGIQDSSSAKAQNLVKASKDCADEISYVKAGQQFSFGGIQVSVIWPYEVENDGGNEDSICLLVQFDLEGDGIVECSAVLTGDLEASKLTEALSKARVSHIDVLKVGHHGSSNALNQELVSMLKPACALISVGANNVYGHPASDTVSLLESVGCVVKRTDLYGDVSCKIMTGGYSVSTQR